MRYSNFISVACAAGLLTLAAGPALAGGPYKLGHGVTANLDLKAILGSAIRTQSRSNDILFPGNVASGRSDDAVSDDGDLNYGKGDFVKGSGQLYGSLKLKYKKFGVFVSGMGWEDYLEDQKSVPHGNIPNAYRPNTPLGQTGFAERAKFNGAVLKQAYAFGEVNLKGHDLTLKVGRQLLLWGRSLFTKGAFTSLNAINLPAYHRPGSGVEQYLTPAGMVKGDFKITDNFDIKAFYQFHWRHATTDPCGTYYDTYDNVAPGCYATFSNQVIVPNRVALAQGLYFRRGHTRGASNGGQYGLKLQYSFKQLKAHVGAYFFNYNARLPIYGIHKNADPRPTAKAPSAFNSVKFFYEYPNDIKVYGLTADKTFANIGNLSLNLSYIDNQPLAFNTPALTSGAAATNLDEPADPRIASGTLAYIKNVPRGGNIDGYKNYGVGRAELAFTTIIPDLLKANKTLVSIRTSFETIPNLPSHSKYRFGRHNNFGLGDPGAGGYVTDFSWGYQVSVKSTYKNAIGPVTLEPNATFLDGVDGFSSDEALQEHQHTLTVGLGLKYKQFSGDLSYTNYNTTHYSTVQDRDYFAFSTSYSF